MSLCCLVLELQSSRSKPEEKRRERDASMRAFGSFYSGMRERVPQGGWVGETDRNVLDKPDPV